MIKLREARYCNLKLFLIFLVIYGHLIEPRIWQSDVLMVQYRWIYLIHMPLFSFLSGLFIHGEKDCSAQFIRLFPLYIFLQIIAVLFGNGMVKLFTPWWHLWYLLSNCIWLCFAWVWFRFCRGKYKVFLLICSIVVGCLAGFVSHIGREFSLSRTVVFFPYFFVGLICKPSFHWKKFRLVGMVAFFIALLIMCYIGDEIPVVFLYHASPYENEKGVLLRLLCYLLGALLALFLLTILPTARLPFSKLGANTLPAYLLHAPIVLYLREWEIPWQFYIVIAVAFLWIMYTLTRWHGNLYGIVSTERGGIVGGKFSKSL